MADGSALPAFDPNQPFTGGTPAPEFDPSKPFTGGEPLHDPTFLDKAKDFAGDFLDAQAHNVAYAEGSSIEHALNANKELNRDFTTPLAKPTEEDREGGQDLALRAMGLPDKVIEATRDIRHEITDPFVPAIEDAAGLASRAAKVGLDTVNVPYQLVVGAGSPAVDRPLGELQVATDPRYTKEERAAMTPEEKAEIGEEMYQNLAQIPLVAEGGLRVPKPHMPPAERFARPPEPVAESATPTAPPQGPAGAPESAAPKPAAPAPAPAPAASVTPAAYVPQFDLTTNTFHVVGPGGERVGPPTGYARPEQAARAADDLNGMGVTKTVAPAQAAQEVVAPLEAKVPEQRISAPPDSTRPVDERIVMVSPDQLQLDPGRFQYKASDENGVTGDLSAVKKWEPALTNPITAWQDGDGNLFVVNGHQRTDLARRAQAAGQTDIQMPARIYNAADGYTPAYMRALGAIQNMAEGSGSSIDAAKVLRALPDLDEGKSLPMAGLNIARGVAKDAQGLAGLTDHGFGLVTNEIIPPEYAAEVGRRIQDPAQQDAALNTLVKEKPQSAAQARFMVDDMLNSGFLGGEQTNLFGTEQLAQSLFGERSQILDNSIRTLRRNKSVFNAAITGDDTLSGAGNVLDREGNLKGKSENEQLIDHLGQATRKGPLSDALTQAARDLAGGQPVSRVTSSFLAKARQVVKSGYDAESVPAGADIGGNGLARPAEARAVADEPYRPTEADGQSGLGFADSTHEFDFQREYEKSLERSAHAERLAAEGQPVRFQGENGRTALASPDIGGKGYRLTYFDEHGPIGHTVYNTPAEAIRDGMRYGEPVDRAGKSLLPEGLAENHAGIEHTDQGDQYVMPGAERKAVQAAAARGDAMTSAKPQKAADFGLFGKPEPEQAGLFDKPKQEVLATQDPHQVAADLVKGRGRETGNEHLAAIDGNTGKPIGAVSGGDKAYVKVPDALMAKLNDPDESVVIHHNHPSGGALSMADVSMLARPGLDTVIAHTHDGDVSRASLTPAIKEVVRNAANPDAAWSRLSVPFKRAWNSTFTLLQDAVGKGKVTPEEAAQLLHESILRAAHENGLLDYTTTHDISHLPTDVVDAAGDRAAYVMRQAMKGADLATDVRRSPEPVRADQALAGLPGENGKAAEAAPARGDNGRPAGPVRNQLPDKTGQFALLDSSLREAPEVKELFARSAETLAKSKGPMRAPERVAKVVGKTIADSMMGRLTRRLVSPGSMDASARIASRGIRQVFGQMYVQDMRAANALKAGSDLLDKMTVGERNEFAMAYEEGRPQASPILTAIADNLRQVTKEATARLKSLGILDDAKENYLGRIWKERGKEGDTDQAEKNVLALMSKTPLKGPGTFLKQRFYDTYRNALESGLEPVHSNPVMTQLVKISEMNRYYAGELIRRGAIDSGLAKFYRQGEAPPDLMKLEGAEFQRLGRMVENADGDKTMVRPGAYYAPEGFARVMNNFQSRGLKGTMFDEPAKYLRAVSNAMNMFQLGLSFFHPMFTSQDASISRIAIGVDQAVRGEFGKAGGNIVKGFSPTNWYTNLKDGDKLLKAILDPDVGTPEQQRLANAFGAGGGRVFMQRVLAPTDEGAIKFWKSGEFGRAIQQAAKKYPGSPLRATMNVVGRTLETTTAPIMDYLVPRQKLGVFSRMATDWLGSHPDATNTEFVAAMQDRWESVDNRLGQMVYDNLFWDKTLKDIAFMTTRSVGWNLGSMREIGGGLADTGKFAYNAATLNSPEWTHRMSYLVALTTYTMAQGAMLNYLFTGKGPEEIKDYFYPKTGYMGRNGAPDRIQLPTYAKDVFAYTHDPVKTLRNKSSPLLSFLSQALDGHDYYGDLIANKNDPLLKQFEDVMKFAGSQFMPFSIQGTRRMLQERPGPAGLMGMFGFTPAPGYITNPLAEQKFLNREHKADTTKTRNHMARENIVAPLKPMPPQAHAAGGRVMSRDDHDRAASMADPDPTDPQIEAGNYQKGHLRIHGLDVSIETAKGQVRRGVGKGGKPWKVTMPNHYGYIRGTVGSDSEQVDCFVGFFPRADHVYIIDQVDPDTRVYDEHKVMLNFPNMPTALAAYRRAFSDGKGARRIGNVRAMTIAEFKEWLRDGDTKSSIAA